MCLLSIYKYFKNKEIIHSRFCLNITLYSTAKIECQKHLQNLALLYKNYDIILKRDKTLLKRPSFLPSHFFRGILFLFSLVFFIFIFECRTLPAQSLRTVKIKIAPDEEFRNDEAWPMLIRRLVKDSSSDFEKHFGIRFEINTFDAWLSDNSRKTTFELLNDLRKKVPKGDGDIVLGFTSQHRVKHDASGVAAYLQGYIVLRKLEQESAMKLLLKHELLHLFGAADLNERSSIMNGKNVGPELDEFTKKIVLLNKHRNFNPSTFPLPENKLDKAISIYKQRKNLNRGEADIHISLALIYLEKKDYESTIKECHQATQIDANLPEPYHLSGIALRRTGEVDRALREYQKVIRLQPELPELRYNLGIAYAKKKMIDEAIKEYRKAIELKPDYAEAHSNLALIYLEKNMVDEAIEECQKALDINPQIARALSTLGGAYLLRKDFAQAEAFSRRALEIDPELDGAHNNLGNIYMNKKMIDRAIGEYLKALRINPGFAEAHYNLGRAYLFNKSFDKAISEFKEAIQLKSGHYQAHSNLAAAYLEKGLEEEAIKECQRAIEINPGYAHAYSNLGQALIKKGMLINGKAVCLKAIALKPDLPEPHNLMGFLLEKEERIEEAKAYYLKAIELKPDYLGAHLNLGNMYFKKDLFPESAIHYKKVVEIDPRFAPAYNNLAVVSFYQKNYDLARKYLKKAEDLGFKVHAKFKKELLKKKYP
jgi:tetratricopeptide (TPR) repeat protein